MFWFPLSGGAQSASTNAPLIEIDLAQYVAGEHVRVSNPPDQWRYLDRMILYDVNGRPNAYAFLFAKVESELKSPAELRQRLARFAVCTRVNQPPLEDSLAAVRTKEAADNDPFATTDLATVITGATADSPLILRHFRGVPEFWVETVRMGLPDMVDPRAKRTTTHVIMVTPVDFRLVSTENRAVTSVPTREKTTAMSLSASDEARVAGSKKTERIRALRKQVQECEARERKRFDSMSPEQKQRHDAAQQQRRVFLLGQWDAKRTAWKIAKTTGGGSP